MSQFKRTRYKPCRARFMKIAVSMPYVWSFYIVCNVMALSCSIAAIQAFAGPLPYSLFMGGMIFCSLYAVLSARQLYTHGRIWPQRIIWFLFPVSFLHFYHSAPLLWILGIFGTNLFLWWVAYRLSGRLAAASPYGGPSGYL